MTLATATYEAGSIAHCALCGAGAASVADLVRPPAAMKYACDQCIHECHQLIAAARESSGRRPWPWVLMTDAEPLRELAQRYDFVVKFRPGGEEGRYNVYVRELDDEPFASGDSPESATRAAVNEVYATLLSRLRSGDDIQFPDQESASQ